MNRPYSRKSITKKPNPAVAAAAATTVTTSTTENANIEAQESVIVNNPASQMKLDLIKEKQREVEETSKINESSAQMVQYFLDLTDGIKDLTESAQGVSKTLENWDHIFGTMGEMNRNKDKPVWVRFKKSTSIVKSTGKMPERN